MLGNYFVTADDMAISEIVFARRVDVTLGGAPCGVDITIQHSYDTTMEFIYHGKPYTFTSTKWRASGMARFLSVFYATARDPATFGVVTYGGEGELTSQPTQPQKFEAIVQACKDVMATLDLILTTHGRAVLDYAVWFRETKPAEDTYSQYIAVLTCRNIVRSNFMEPSVVRTVVMLP